MKLQKTIFDLRAIFLLIALIFSGEITDCLADSYTTILIHSNIYGDYAPQINKIGSITWYGSDGSDYEIFYYNFSTASVTQLTNNNTNDINPQLNGNGQIVWQGFDGSDYEIFLGNGDGSIAQLTHNNYDDIDPQINDNGQVVWSGYDGSHYQIYLYNGNSTTNISYSSNSDYVDAHINNSGQVAYRSSGNDLYLYAGGNNTCLGCYAYGGIQINELGGIVYQCSDDVYYYNNNTSINISNTWLSGNDLYPQINQNGYVVWQGEEYVSNDNTHDLEIYLYNGSSKKAITNNNLGDYKPQINKNGLIVWYGYDGNDYEIYVYNKNINERLTFNTSDDYDPQINDLGMITFVGADGIYLSWSGNNGNTSRYDFKYYYSSTSADYYIGYVYAPTSFKTSGPQLSVGSTIYYQPMSFWDYGYVSFDGGYYEITAITDGYNDAYDKQSVITAYYDGHSSEKNLEVDSISALSNNCIYVYDRTLAMETGYAFNGDSYAYFSPYSYANIDASAAMPIYEANNLANSVTQARIPFNGVVYWRAERDWLEED